VLDTWAGPSVVREDVLPPGWKQQARRAPRSPHVCDASGQLLKVKSQVGLSVYVGGASMTFLLLAVKSLSVPVILGMDIQKEHVTAIYPVCETVAWNRGGLTRAENAWDGKKKEPNPVKGNPTRRDKGAIYLRQGVDCTFPLPVPSGLPSFRPQRLLISCLDLREKTATVPPPLPHDPRLPPGPPRPSSIRPSPVPPITPSHHPPPRQLGPAHARWLGLGGGGGGGGGGEGGGGGGGKRPQSQRTGVNSRRRGGGGK